MSDVAIRKPRLSVGQQERLIEEFIAETGITETSIKIGINKNTVDRYFKRLRLSIFNEKTKPSAMYSGSVFLSEDFYIYNKDGYEDIKTITPAVGVMIRKRKVIAFCLSQGNTLNKRSKFLNPHSRLEAIIYKSVPKVNVKAKRHQLVLSAHVDELSSLLVNEFFWIFKKRIEKCNGISKNMFELYVKEFEWRTNTPPSQQVYELKLIARKYISKEIEIGERPFKNFSEDLMMVDAINKWAARENNRL